MRSGALDGNQGSSNPTGVSVLAYLEHTRAESSEGSVKINVGNHSYNLMRSASTAPFTASTSPGLACRSNAAGGDDCIIAYVPRDSDDNILRVRKFSVTEGSNRYELSWNATTYTPSSSMRTVHAITAWYHSGYFWIAATYWYGGAVSVWRSLSGTSWSLISFDQDKSYVGPSAIPTAHGTNYLVFAR